ncbi:MAG: 3-hydroxybutyryl-CoA dehydrogenase, partial [Flavobacteriales bacterium]|nr:3-hydroxybutyryl-CoA dehydrogenase [Flavobacteriales bacterium]
MDSSMTVGVVGAGTMGSGIAQVAAQAGHPVVLYDTRLEALDKAKAALAKVMGRLVEKGNLDREEAEAIQGRITYATGLEAFTGRGLVIEAIVEDLQVKQGLFKQLEDIAGPDAVLATNTSSLSVTAIGGA